MRKVFFIACALLSLTFNSCNSCQGDNYEYDSEYWESVNREEAYKKMGRDDLKKQEARYRQDRLRGKTKGDYTNEKGEDTRIYKGSKEQQRDLDMIDEYMKNNPGF